MESADMIGDWTQDESFQQRAAEVYSEAVDRIGAVLIGGGLDESMVWTPRNMVAREFRNMAIRRPIVESPIEALFLIALAAEATKGLFRFTNNLGVGRYRADFLFFPPPDPADACEHWSKGRCLSCAVEHGHGVLIVECDGHDYHERTPDQAEHDRSRDRWMTARNLTVMRFTGREIWRNPHKCAAEVTAWFQGRDEQQE